MEENCEYITKDGELFKIICEENMCRLIKVISENDLKGIIPPAPTPQMSPKNFKTIWMKLTSNALGYDWKHSIDLSDNKIEQNIDVDSLDNLLEFTDIVKIDCNLLSCKDPFYIVYHVQDIYSDCQEIFLNFEEANKKFFKYCQEQEIGIENENIIRTVKKTFTRTESTLYNIDNTISGPHISYISRWVLEKIH